MKTFALGLSLTALGVISCSGDTMEYRPATVSAIQVAKAPVIDGQLSEECWQEAFEVAQFHVLGKTEAAKYPTSFKLLWTPEALYLGIRCDKGKPPQKLKASKLGRDGDAFSDDSIEIFLRPTQAGDEYFQFVANGAGSIYDGMQLDRSWNGQCRAATTATPEAWILEMEIKFTSFTGGGPKTGQEWGFSICRNEVEGKERSCWNDLGAGYHEPENFGCVQFIEPVTAAPRLAAMNSNGLNLLYLAPQSAATHMEGLTLPAKFAEVKQVTMINPSFEQGLDGWQVLFSEHTYGKQAPASVSKEVKRVGESSLCVTSTNPLSLIQVTRKVGGLAPGHYEASAFLRLDSPAQRDGVNLFVSGSRKDIRGAETALQSTIVDDTLQADGWRRQAVRFTVSSGGSAKIGVEVINYVGRVWIDDVAITPCPGDRLKNDGLWFWDAYFPKNDGMAPRLRLFALIATNSPWVDCAERYNNTLVAAAFARDRLQQLQRASAYNGAAVDPGLVQRLADIYAQFDKLDRLFIGLYMDKKEAELAGQVVPLLEKMKGDVASFQSALDSALTEACRQAKNRAGEWPAPPPPPVRERYRVAGNGKVNQLVFGQWGKYEYLRVGRALDLWDHTSAVTDASPPVLPDGTFDWTTAITKLKEVQALGIATIGLRTTILSGNGGPITPAFRKKYEKDPDVLGAGDKFNLWHPVIQEMLIALSRDIGTKLRGQPDNLFYHYAWESGGPGKLSTDATDPAKSSGLASFQRYLTSKHGSIEKLNQAWGGKITSFQEITTKLLTDPQIGKAVNYDYQLWRQDSYMDLCLAMYKAWKEADPDTAVLAAHSGLMSSIDPTRVFETCDILNNHGGWRWTPNLYLSSTAPVEKKFTCTFENFWQYQEQAHRWGDERAQFAAIAKYLYRNALLGQTLQTWCFPYTSQEGWNWRQAQWAQTRDDYLTMRYCASALPVAKRRVENLQNIYFLGAARERSDFLVVWPRTTWLQEPDSVRKELDWLGEWMNSVGLMFEFRTEARIADAKEQLDQYRVILLPMATYLQKGVDDKLLEWVRQGGTLVCLGPAGAYDEYGRAGRFMAEMIGVTPELKDKKWVFGDKVKASPLIRQPVGKGSVTVVPLTRQEFFDDNSARSAFLDVIRSASRQVARSDGDLFEFYPRLAADGTRYLGILNSNPDTDVTATVHLAGAYKRVVDVDIPGGLAIPIKVEGETTSFPLRLAPADMTVVRLDAK